MGETGDWLEQHGATGMIHCLRHNTFLNTRCEDCKTFADSQGYDGETCPEVTGDDMADVEELAGS